MIHVCVLSWCTSSSAHHRLLHLGRLLRSNRSNLSAITVRIGETHTMSLPLSIIIVSWNTRYLLADCLAAIPDGIAPLSLAQVETIAVVHNASTDDSAAMVMTRFPGYASCRAVRTLALPAATIWPCSTARDALLFAQQRHHCDAKPARMVEFMEQHPTSGAIGAKLLNPDRSFQASYAAFPTLWSEFCLLTGLACCNDRPICT